MAHERDERWVYVALAVLVIAYVVYRYRGSIDLPAVSLRGLRRLGGTIPYVLATLMGVFFQAWGRRKAERVRKQWENALKLEGIVRQGTDVAVWYVGRRRQSFRADIYLTGAALYVFDRARRREPVRLALGRRIGGGFIEGATLRAGPAGGPRTVRILTGGVGGANLEFATPDVEAWWTRIRRSLGQPTDVEAELAKGDGDEGPGTESSIWGGIVDAVREEIEVRRES